MSGKMTVLVILAATALAEFALADSGLPLVLRDGVSGTRSSVKNQKNSQEHGNPAPSPAPAFDQSVLIQRYGSIVDRRPIGAGGLTAWTVLKNGRKLVLYTTADGQAIISGVVWDSLTGHNLSDPFVTGVSNVLPPLGGAAVSDAPSAEAARATNVGALLGHYTGPIPESIKTVDSLAGIKEGRGGQADTLYVIFDPRCPYCRKAYNMTRDYVKRGFTIKWIPVLALSNPAQGTPIAATVLQSMPSEQADVLRRVLGEKEEIRTEPTQATKKALSRNLNFFFAAFHNNGTNQAGVPAAFFLDKRTGQPRMMTGISELPVVEAVFGKLP